MFGVQYNARLWLQIGGLKLLDLWWELSRALLFRCQCILRLSTLIKVAVSSTQHTDKLNITGLIQLRPMANHTIAYCQGKFRLWKQLTYGQNCITLSKELLTIKPVTVLQDSYTMSRHLQTVIDDCQDSYRYTLYVQDIIH